MMPCLDTLLNRAGALRYLNSDRKVLGARIKVTTYGIRASGYPTANHEFTAQLGQGMTSERSNIMLPLRA